MAGRYRRALLQQHHRDLFGQPDQHPAWHAGGLCLSRFTFKAGFIKNNDITFFFISQRIMPPVVLSIPFFIMLGYLGLLDSSSA